MLKELGSSINVFLNWSHLNALAVDKRFTQALACSYCVCLMPWDLAFSSIQSLTCVQLFATPWTAAHQASLSITKSWSLLKLMSIELVMPSNHLIFCLGPCLGFHFS